MDATLSMFLYARARARASGDAGLERAVQADLDRMDYREPVVTERVTKPDGMETTSVQVPERAVPQQRPREQRRGGRPPLPRCPHNKIVGRCTKCKTA